MPIGGLDEHSLFDSVNVRFFGVTSIEGHIGGLGEHSRFDSVSVHLF